MTKTRITICRAVFVVGLMLGLGGCYTENVWLASDPTLAEPPVRLEPKEKGGGSLRYERQNLVIWIRPHVMDLVSMSWFILGFRSHQVRIDDPRERRVIAVNMYTDSPGVRFRDADGTVKYLDDRSELPPMSIRYERQRGCLPEKWEFGRLFGHSDEIEVRSAVDLTDIKDPSRSPGSPATECFQYFYPSSLNQARPYEVTFGRLVFPDGSTEPLRVFFMPVYLGARAH